MLAKYFNINKSDLIEDKLTLDEQASKMFPQLAITNVCYLYLNQIKIRS